MTAAEIASARQDLDAAEAASGTARADALRALAEELGGAADTARIGDLVDAVRQLAQAG